MIQEAGRPQVYDHRLRDLVRRAGAFPDRLRRAGSAGSSDPWLPWTCSTWQRWVVAAGGLRGPLRPIRRPIGAAVSLEA